jgi:hypothetical protein
MLFSFIFYLYFLLKKKIIWKTKNKLKMLNAKKYGDYKLIKKLGGGGFGE